MLGGVGLKKNKEKIENTVYKCCFTGYRPAKFPFRLSESDKAYIDFENALFEGITNLIEEGCKIFYTGMAMGFDIIAAETVALIKKARKDLDIKLICVVPFQNQEEGFGSYWREKYNRIIEDSDEKIIISDSYHKGCYQIRNKYMVDNSDFVLTWFDGKSGGTKNTLDYAASKNRKIFNINDSNIENYAFQTVFELI